MRGHLGVHIQRGCHSACTGVVIVRDSCRVSLGPMGGYMFSGHGLLEGQI